ncbi:MAG: MerC domain-containing protein [Gammaproteobacteria bacterium]|nr:MerC domain-containing protein [Gammaproteobacteria bacterium]
MYLFSCYHCPPAGDEADEALAGLSDRACAMMTDHHDHSRARLDFLAVLLSGVCLLHCLLLPLLLVGIPVIHGTVIMDETVFHLAMLVFILPVSAFALTWGCRKHKDIVTIVLGGTGMFILIVTATFGHERFGLIGERLVTSVGGIILAGGHIRNFMVCRRADCEHDHSPGSEAP